MMKTLRTTAILLALATAVPAMAAPPEGYPASMSLTITRGTSAGSYSLPWSDEIVGYAMTDPTGGPDDWQLGGFSFNWHFTGADGDDMLYEPATVIPWSGTGPGIVHSTVWGGEASFLYPLSAAPIPEPAALALLCVGLSSLLLRRSK